MAIDTREKRFSMMNFGSGVSNLTLFEADGSIDAGDRAHLLGLYSGILTVTTDGLARLIFLTGEV